MLILNDKEVLLPACHKFIRVIVLNLSLSATALAQHKLAIISDPDGYALVRAGQGKNFNVLDTLFSDDFCYYELAENSDWARITAWKAHQSAGFIHKSRIQDFESLNKTQQKNLITAVLEKHRLLASNFQKAWQSKNDSAYRTTVRQLENHSDSRYDPVLDILPGYFCATRDLEVLNLFIAALWADKGSANEMPSYAIGNCYLCEPDLFLDAATKLGGEQKAALLDHAEWGLLNHFTVEEGKAADPQFLALKKRLDIERKKSKQ